MTTSEGDVILPLLRGDVEIFACLDGDLQQRRIAVVGSKHFAVNSMTADVFEFLRERRTVAQLVILLEAKLGRPVTARR